MDATFNHRDTHPMLDEAHRCLARGGHKGILQEMLDNAAQRSDSQNDRMTRWAAAVGGVGAFPVRFAADHWICDEANRRDSIAALERAIRVEQGDSLMLERQRMLLRRPPRIAEVAVVAEGDLSRLLAERANSSTSATKPSVRRKVLRGVSLSLEAHSLRPVLIHGTLLGHHREGRLMDTDEHLDFGVLDQEFSQDAVAEALAAFACYTKSSSPDKVHAHHDLGLDVNVYRLHERGGLFWHGDDIREWWNSPFEIVDARFHGAHIWVPADTDLVLREHYGVWDTKPAFFESGWDNPNARFRQSRTAMMAVFDQCKDAIERRDRWKTEIAATALRDTYDVDLTDCFGPSPLLSLADS